MIALLQGTQSLAIKRTGVLTVSFSDDVSQFLLLSVKLNIIVPF